MLSVVNFKLVSCKPWASRAGSEAPKACEAPNVLNLFINYLKRVFKNLSSTGVLKLEP